MVVYVGGSYNQNPNNGLFYQNSNSATNKNASIGSQLLKTAHQYGLHACVGRLSIGMDIAHLMVKIVSNRMGLVPSIRAREKPIDNKETFIRQMKRISNLWDKIVSHENLEKAVKEVCRSHRWVYFPKVRNKVTTWMESGIEARINELKTILEDGYIPGEVKNKRRYDVNAGKWRDIVEPPLFPDQCIHHAIIQVLEPVMMRGMDHWCCGSIKGRGAHYGIKAMKKWMLRKDTPYCIELDIYHFYESIRPEGVMDRMKRLIKDHKTLDLIWRIVKDGVSIGAYTSQWFANTLLQPLDQLIRNTGATKYIRYMDNFTIFTKRKRTADKIIKAISEWLRKHGLRLKGNWQKFHRKYRLPNALGYKFGEGYTLLRKKNLLRLKRLLKRFYRLWESGKFIPVKFAQGLLSRLGLLRHCNSVHLYRRFLKKHTQRHLKDVIRTWQKEVVSTWNSSLEPASAGA